MLTSNNLVKKISIIMPVLNEAAALQEHLPALQSWREAGHQLIVVDGGSTDDSAGLAAPQVDLCLRSPPGRARQMNVGARRAEGEVLLFLHIDSQLPPDADVLVLQALGQGCVWGRFDVRLSGPQRAFRLIETAMNLRSRLTGVATGDQAIFVTREAFDQAGAYADVPLMEDVMLSKALRRISKPACLRARVLSSSRRWEQHGISRTVWLMWRLRLAFFLGASPHKLHSQYYAQPAFEWPQARILFFAKAAVAGQVKTRMHPVLGAEGALALHNNLIRYGWQQLAAARLAPMELWLAASEPGAGELTVDVCGPQQIHKQKGADLGARMQNAASSALERAQFVIIVGADCPSVDAAYVRQALVALAAGVPVVLGPAEDGGYVLVGMSQVHEAMFSNIAWGKPEVMAQTRERLQTTGVDWQELSLKWDVDRPEDLARLETLPGWAQV